MPSEPSGEGNSPHERRPPIKRPMVIRIFSALKRYENRRRRRAEKENSPHQVNERMMARWTRHVGLFTAGLVLVGVFTAIVFYRQLNVMQNQLGEMKATRESGDKSTADELGVMRDQAKAMQDQRALMQQQLLVMQDESAIRISELSPKMKLEIITDVAPAGMVPAGWYVTPKWQNTGQTEALEFRGWDAVLAVPVESAGAHDFSKPPGPLPNPPSLTIGVGEAITQGSLLLSADAIEKAIAKEIMIISYGGIEWHDIFPGTLVHFRRWCSVLAPHEDGKGTVYFSQAVVYQSNCNSSGNYKP